MRDYVIWACKQQIKYGASYLHSSENNTEKVVHSYF